MLRGDTVTHPKYAGRRLFGAGINLTHLYQGKIRFLWYLLRDLGLVNKLYRGLALPERVARGGLASRSSGSPRSRASPSAATARSC